jgi:hypothetical protein
VAVLAIAIAVPVRPLPPIRGQAATCIASVGLGSAGIGTIQSTLHWWLHPLLQPLLDLDSCG